MPAHICSVSTVVFSLLTFHLTVYFTEINNVLLLYRYYPYHYAPYLSDIHNTSKLMIEFDLGKPFMPFEQLLAVLPAASKDLLPKCYQVGCNILRDVSLSPVNAAALLLVRVQDSFILLLCILVSSYGEHVRLLFKIVTCFSVLSHCTPPPFS